ncbi:GPI ethanolamine phosphate transferase [Hortaea werneckii]|nr:GPI ethanolamine phosphate transferase [Hortaea werneckii]
MARLGRAGFLGIAMVFHIIYIYSIFDIYFVSSVVQGMRAYRVEGSPLPAERVVLFVGDGLRADKTFQWFPDPHDNSGLDVGPMAPFLRSRVLEHGTFGVSHTRVPTESRPGHVALIAGLYEDVAAVTTGWKLNPVNFDSVFNRSRHTWSWGSPDILPMFSTGATPGRVEDDMYEADFEDCSKDATELDSWVFNRVKKLFEDAETDQVLRARLEQDKIVFFLHLLGLDTTGHAYRPYSQEYLRNIQFVDRGVQEITDTINHFYKDERTAFVFTSDHGMSDWGSHGDGHPDNTRTPLIAWGSGVAGPRLAKTDKSSGHEDGFSSDWRLDHVHRYDVSQADVAILMAYLAGLEFPVNSVGKLPLSFLDATDEHKAKALFVNAKAILEMYHVKERKKMAEVLRYKPYPSFADAQDGVENRLASIEQLIQERNYTAAMKQTDELIETGLHGLSRGHLLTLASTLVGLYSLLNFQTSPITYYAYAFFPVAFWAEVFARWEVLVEGKNILFSQLSKNGATRNAFNFAAYLALLEIMIYTVLYLAGTTWPLLYGMDFVRANRMLCVQWAFTCAAMSVFTLLPANKSENITLILIGGMLILLPGVLYVAFEKRLSRKPPSQDESDAVCADGTSKAILCVQVGLVGLAMLVTKSSATSLQAKKGLPLEAQFAGWITLIASLVLPFAHCSRPSKHYLHRLVIVFLAFGPLFVILTISYEGFFYFFMAMTLISWVRLEHKIHEHFDDSFTATVIPGDDCRPVDSVEATSSTHGSSTAEKWVAEQPGAPLAPDVDTVKQSGKAGADARYRSLGLSDARTCLFFLFLLQSAFFSTGNIASISSFSLDAVYRLIPVFDPFSQAGLLIFKIFAPFALVSANLGFLTKRLKLRGGSLFAVVMGISDYMTLRFFWRVKDEGSWLEIGESISMFIIASALCVFVAGLEALSEIFSRGVKFEDEVRHENKTG